MARLQTGWSNVPKQLDTWVTTRKCALLATHVRFPTAVQLCHAYPAAATVTPTLATPIQVGIGGLPLSFRLVRPKFCRLSVLFHYLAGVCVCLHNTMGDRCDLCSDGFYFNGEESRRGSPQECQPCPCPENSACALMHDGSVVCTNCPPGHAGR